MTLVRSFKHNSPILVSRLASNSINISRECVLAYSCFNRKLHSSKVQHRKPQRTGYNSSDSTIYTDDILTDNNPWSPTLYEDSVLYRKPRSIRSIELPSNYRLSYQPLYESPTGKYVGIMKRLTISFAVLGAYGAKLFFDSPNFDDIYAGIVLATCVTPALVVQYKTRDYVSRIFRLYDKDKPQTLENLLADEKLIVEKLTWSGGKTYNSLLKITGNNSLQLVPEPKDKLSAALAPYASWKDVDEETKIPRVFYVADDVGGLKMDRIWGIVEHNSGVDNGRYMEEEDKRPH
ncbi:hypothetical protein CLIB1423_26S01090 [[Candida] railenensis]|uniref:Uncharacterized protein n=1 Tax=[Candida] railenensis TaxID=45579 RepID=A0A9P0QTN3_9ASCO|nr:hypothetical protein CLIB1423_26S01090 [[Candida] railenensis]